MLEALPNTVSTLFSFEHQNADAFYFIDLFSNVPVHSLICRVGIYSKKKKKKRCIDEFPKTEELLLHFKKKNHMNI